MKLTPNRYLIYVLMVSGVLGSVIGLWSLYHTFFSYSNDLTVLGTLSLFMTVGSFGMILLIWKSAKDIIQMVSFSKESFKIHRPLSGRRIEVRTDRLLGYSKSLDDVSWGTEFLKRNCLTIYFLDNIPPIEFVQYQINGLKEFEAALKKAKVSFLGFEEIYRDYFGKRTYFEFERKSTVQYDINPPKEDKE